MIIGLSLIGASFLPGWERDSAACDRFRERPTAALAFDQRDVVDIERAAGERLGELARMRGIPPGGPVEVEFQDRGWFLGYFRRKIESMAPPESRDAFVESMRMLGIISEDHDWIHSQALAWSSGVWGLVDTDRSKLVLSRDMPDSRLESVLTHELVHVLQDRNFPAALRPSKGGDDASTALDALREGEAVVLAAQWGAQRGVKDDQERSDDYEKWWRIRRAIENGRRRSVGCPERLGAYSDFAYHQGAIYVQRLVQQGGWKLVDRVWENPAETTREILHPSQGGPSGNRLEPLGEWKNRPPSSTVRWEGALGFYGWSEVLTPKIGASESGKVMEGFRGDRLVYVDQKGRPRGGLIARIRCENQVAARRFLSTLERFGNGRRRGTARSQLRGNDVWWVVGFDAWAADRLLAGVGKKATTHLDTRSSTP